jgi:hypothetical protein
MTYSTNNAEVLKQTSRALDVFEQLESIIEKLVGLAESDDLSKPGQVELNIHIERLRGVVSILDSEENLAPIFTQVTANGNKSRIERLGIAGDIIKLYYRDGLSHNAILSKYNNEISNKTLTRFLRMYEALSPQEKSKVYNQSKDSIFDTQNQLEKLLTMINVQLGRLAYTNDAKQQENHRGYIAELRQLVKLASDFRKDVQEDLERRQFQKDMSYIMLNVCTLEQREQIMNILRKYQLGGMESITMDLHMARTENGVIDVEESITETSLLPAPD